MGKKIWNNQKEVANHSISNYKEEFPSIWVKNKGRDATYNKIKSMLSDFIEWLNFYKYCTFIRHIRIVLNNYVSKTRLHDLLKDKTIK